MTSNSSDLRVWLIDVANLSGKAVDRVLEQCEQDDIYTVADLRDLATNEEYFQAVFSARLTRLKIETALAKDTTQAKGTSVRHSATPNNVAKAFDEVPTAPPAKIGSTQDLPEGKR